MKNKVYDVTKFIALVVLPAAGTLYFALAGLWNLPNADQVVGTVVAVDTFLGVLLGLSSARYNASDEKYDGEMRVHPDQAVMVFKDGGLDPDELSQKKSLQMKIVKKEEPASLSPGDLPPVAPPV